MGRPKRVDVGGYAYHVLNRAVGRKIILRQDKDFEAFESMLQAAVLRYGGEKGGRNELPDRWAICFV